MAGLACLASLGVLAGCSTGTSSDGSVVTIESQQPTGPFTGLVLARAIDMPNAILTDQNGRRVNLAELTKGKVAAVYVGFTHCPDVCPTVTADVAAAVRGLPAQERKDVEVLFVSSDPKRDTPARLRSWLGFYESGIDRGIVGLTGTGREARAVAHQLGVPVSKPKRQPDGSWVVDHGSQVLLFGRDGTSRLVHTSGFTPEDLRTDISLLIRGEQPQ